MFCIYLPRADGVLPDKPNIKRDPSEDKEDGMPLSKICMFCALHSDYYVYRGVSGGVQARQVCASEQV